MKKIRIGVFGAYRGTSMISYCEVSDRAEVVAICDKWDEALEIQKENLKDDRITYYHDFEDFIRHDMDAVVLANYATEHAPFAIRCLERGLHVFSEVLPCQTMKEAVELIEAIEKSGRIYAYGENYCYMPAVYEMRRLYREGKIGEFEYGEGEYIHNGEPFWPSVTYGERDHWRNDMYINFYCTHSIGPIIHMTGLRPVSVVGFESLKNERKLRVGAKSGLFGIEMITLENGGIIKSIHGWLYKNSIWYTVYGSKGRMESAREDAKCGDVHKIYVNADKYSGEYQDEHLECYEPVSYDPEKVEAFGHGGSDYYCIDQFVKKVLGDPEADTIDIYEALDMYLPGMFAYRSVLDGGIPKEIPNLRDPAVRGQYRNDTACTDPKVAGDQLLPTCSTGTPEIPDEVYEDVLKKWQAELARRDGYLHAATTQGQKEVTDINLK